MNSFEQVLWCYRIDGRAVAQEMAVGLEGAQLECECLAVGASEEHLQPIEAAVQAAGIRFNALVSNIFVLQRAFFTEKSSCALLDIGAGSMDFIICRAGRVLRVGSLPIGSDIITEDIRQAVNFDFSHAEQLKRCFNKLDASLYGKGVVLDCSDEDVPERNVSFDFLYDIIQNRVNELVAVFFSSVAEEFAENGIGCLYITGGGIRLDAFQEALTAKFSLPVASLDLQKIPEPYRSPENAAGYGMLRYMQLRFAHLYANRQEAEKTESFSFMHRIRNFMRL